MQKFEFNTSPSKDLWKEILEKHRENKEEGDDELWAIRHSLMRKKPPAIILPDPGWKKVKPALGQIFDVDKPPELPFACKCEICCAQYFPATVHVTDQEARQLVSSLVLDARQDLTFLREVLTDHADFIVTRWKKKSREKRSVFLSQNVDVFDKKFAAIHLLHMRSSPENCDFNSELMRSLQGVNDPKMKEWLSQALHGSRLAKMISAYQDTWLLPYLDSDMLSEDPSLLLALLHHRTIHEPEDWILFDDMNADLAERFGIITQTFNAHCVVMQGPDLGKLVKWNAEQAHRHQIIGFTKAYTIFQAQQRMMAFLRKFVAGLLDEANEPPVQQVHPKWDQLVSAGFSRIDPSFAWSTESARPFCSPPKFDPVEIHELAKSRHRVLKDHIELLQTDPAYVQHHARAYKNALFLETMKHGDKWPHIVDQVFLHPLLRECYWRQMLYECDNMERAWLASVETPSEATRALYNDAILMVQDLCIEMLAVFIKLSSVIYQRGFERNFEFTGSGRNHHLNRKFTTKDWFPHDILYWSISCMGHDKYRPFTMDPSLNFRIIDYICRTDPKEASRMDQNLVDELSDMAALNTISTNIQCLPSLNRKRTCKLSDEETESRANWIKKSNSAKGPAIGDATAKYLDDFYTKHPWPKGMKNEQWLKQATASRFSLNRFWQAFRSQWAKKLGENGVWSSSIDEDLDLMRAHDSEQYRAEVVAERDDVRYQEYKRRMHEQSQSVTPAQMQTVWGDENQAPSLLQSSNKPRRQKKPEVSATSSQAPLPTALIPPSKPPAPLSLIPVKHDNMTIFHHMFPSCGEESQRSFSWQHFLSAMIDAGFSILQSQGSAITLKQDEERCEGVRTIVVHRPHPSPTINPIMLRSIAKRMTKWFGWKRELFIERGKERKEGDVHGSEA
ncbi:hypothetical protein KCU89_g8691, partial [Aureobasidium melanogenum]